MSDRLGIFSGTFTTASEIEENTRTGVTMKLTREGSYAECFAVRQQWRNAGPTQLMLRSKGDAGWELTGYFPYDELGQYPNPSPNIHELEVDVAQVSWTYNQVFIALLGGDAAAQPIIASIARIVQDFQAGLFSRTEFYSLQYDDAVAALNNATGGSGGTGGNAYAVKMFKNIVGRGNDTFIENRNVYRRTLTAASNADTRASFTGCGKIWTSAEVTAFEGLPGTLFSLETGQLWLKSKPHIVAIANQKTQVNYSYTGALTWTSLLYEKYSAATLLDA